MIFSFILSLKITLRDSIYNLPVKEVDVNLTDGNVILTAETNTQGIVVFNPTQQQHQLTINDYRFDQISMQLMNNEDISIVLKQFMSVQIQFVDSNGRGISAIGALLYQDKQFIQTETSDFSGLITIHVPRQEVVVSAKYVVDCQDMNLVYQCPNLEFQHVVDQIGYKFIQKLLILQQKASIRFLVTENKIPVPNVELLALHNFIRNVNSTLTTDSNGVATLENANLKDQFNVRVIDVNYYLDINVDVNEQTQTQEIELTRIQTITFSSKTCELPEYFTVKFALKETHEMVSDRCICLYQDRVKELKVGQNYSFEAEFQGELVTSSFVLKTQNHEVEITFKPGLEIGQIIGISFGAVVIALICVIIGLTVCWKNKQTAQYIEMKPITDK